MTPFTIKADFKLGFLGGGQLARMSAYQAYRFGIQTAVFRSGEVKEPMDFVTPHIVIGSFDDEQALIDFAKTCDVVTLENEFLDSGLLKRVRDKSGTPMYPSPETFELIENKWIEKETFRKAGIPVPPYRIVKNEADLSAFGNEFGWPFMLKSSKGGYDGYGNATARDMSSALAGFEKLGGNLGRDILAEAFVPFVKELAVSVARTQVENEIQTVVYPCVESIQAGHICKTVIAPAPISEELQRKAQDLAIKAVEAINGIGVYAFEFFLTSDNQILLNESAPRPHNSGHYTMEGCVASQFENHVRSVCGMPLGSTEMRKPVAVMENILGTHKRDSETEHVIPVLSASDAHLHLYGKLQSKPGRKMGHLTVLGDSVNETLALAKKLESQIEV
ncbi:5-(carboxyamino)imidazole ribonucleotide synthase [bacterium]|nr:MAG: 5-(carboxyamino)imidazole ribonucleotide synthase [bacterium]